MSLFDGLLSTPYGEKQVIEVGEFYKALETARLKQLGPAPKASAADHPEGATALRAEIRIRKPRASQPAPRG